MRSTLAAIAVALTLANAGGARAAAACEMRQIGELAVDTSKPGSPTVEAQVNGQSVRMIVDTGSNQTILTRPTAKRLGLAPVRVYGLKTYGVGGAAQGFIARIDEFKLAGMVARNLPLLVNGERDMGSAGGLLGASVLLQADVEFDLPEGKLRFFKPQNCAGDQVVYWGTAYSVAAMLGDNTSSISVLVKLNGKPIDAIMDSGSDRTSVTAKAAAYAGTTASVASGEAQGIGPRMVAITAGLFDTFQFGDETVHHARLELGELYSDNTEMQAGSRMPVKIVDQPSMLLGADFFRSHRIYVSRGQHKVYVSYVGGPVFAKPGAASGGDTKP